MAALLWFFNLRLDWFQTARAWLFKRPVPAVDIQPAKQAQLDAEMYQLKEENKYLRKLIGANLPAAWQFIPAQVLAKTANKLTLDVGQNEGVEPGMIVLALGEAGSRSGILIGKITSVNAVESTVGFVDEARVKTTSGIAGKISRENQLLQLIEVRQSLTLNQGDLVLTEGGDGWLPGIVVGRIDKIDNVATSIYQTAAIVPVIDPALLTKVFIVKLSFEN